MERLVTGGLAILSFLASVFLMVVRRSVIFFVALFMGALGLMTVLGLYPGDLFEIGELSNGKGMFRDIIMVVVPVASVSLAAVFDYLVHGQRSGSFINAALLVLASMLLVVSFVMITKYATLPPGTLPATDFDKAWAHIKFMVALAFSIEFLLAIGMRGAISQQDTAV